jgi:hypothetical protein
MKGIKKEGRKEMHTLLTKIEPFRAVSSLMMEAVRTSETSVDNHFTRQYNPEDSSEHHTQTYKSFYK